MSGNNQTVLVQIADDHDVVRAGFRTIIADTPDIIISDDDITSGFDLFRGLERVKPDILLLDVMMPGLADLDKLLQTLSKIARDFPKTRVIIVTALQDAQITKAAVQQGAAGYLLKEEALSNHLPHAIREVASGGVWYSPKSQALLFKDETATPAVRLTEHQRTVLQLMVEGLDPSQIAHQTRHSVDSVYAAQHAIRSRLRAATNEQAIIQAITTGLVRLATES